MKKVLAGAVIIVVSLFVMSTSMVLAQRLACEGNFDCDQDVDGTDAAVFKSDFGRSPFLNPCPACPPSAPVPKTGQKASYATGDDGDLEKGVAWPDPRFTDNGDGTVTDNLTGLIWVKNADCFGKRNWYNAISDANGLANGQCGLTDGSEAGDWRLPNIKELFSLVDVGRYGPALPLGHPFNNVQLYTYCSSSAGIISDQHWYVNMFSGGMLENGSKDFTDYYVWPVRGGQ